MEAAYSWAAENWGVLALAIPAIIGAFAQLATLTPNTSDDKFFQKLLDITNWLGRNTGKAKNS